MLDNYSQAINKLDTLLEEGRAAKQSLKIVEAQKLALKQENKRLYAKLDEAQMIINQLSLEIAELSIRRAAKVRIWTNEGEL